MVGQDGLVASEEVALERICHGRSSWDFESGKSIGLRCRFEHSFGTNAVYLSFCEPNKNVCTREKRHFRLRYVLV